MRKSHSFWRSTFIFLNAVGTQLSSSQGDVTIYYLHSLYLHPSDALGSLNVGIMFIGSENYTLWSKAMQLALLGKNKVGSVDETVTRELYSGNLAHLWDRYNTIVVSWILCNVSKGLHEGVLFCSNAQLVWRDLIK